MTWPFENNTNSFTTKMAKRYIRADNKTNLLLILTIALSVCMVLSIALASAGIAEKQKNAYRNKAQVTIVGPTDEQLMQLRESSHVQWIGEYSLLGFSYQNGAKVFVAYADDDYFRKESGVSYTGELPIAEDEIMLEQDYIEHYGIDCKIGDTISLDLTGTEKQDTYKISGVIDSNLMEENQDFYIYVSKALAQKIADATLDGHLQITAYTRLDTKEISSNGILSAAYGVTQSINIGDGQVFLTDYFAVMSGVIRAGLNISIPLLMLITSVLAAVVIYSIFLTTVTKNVQTFGQLRTIGMTKRQVKKMVNRTGRQFAVKGILLGLLGGIIIGFLICPSGFRIKTTLTYGMIAVIISAIAVKFAIYKPVKIASATSPIEGVRYLSYEPKKTHSRKLHRKLTCSNLAVVNINRNRKKALFTFLTLSISGIVFLTSALVANSIDAEKQAKFLDFPDGDIQIEIQNIARTTFDANGEYNYSTRLQLENNPLENSSLLNQLYEIDGVETITPHNAIMATIAYSGGMGSVTIIGTYVPTITQEDFLQISNLLSDGNTTYTEMTEQNGILVDEQYAAVGDILTVTLRGVDGNALDLKAPVVGVYDNSKLMEEYPVVPGEPRFLMTYDTAKALTGVSSQTGVLSVSVDHEKYETVLSTIKDIADTSDEIDYFDISQTIENINLIYSSSIKTLYMISIILFLFGGISLTNNLLVDFRNRTREFGLLKAVGATQSQLKKMLHREIMIHLGATFLFSIMGSAIISYVVCRRLDESRHCITFAFPWLFFFAFIILLALIYCVFSFYASCKIKNTSIMQAIRE